MSVFIFCATEKNFIPFGDFVTSLLNLMYLFHFVIDKFTELPSKPAYSITEGNADYLELITFYWHFTFPLSNLKFQNSPKDINFMKINYIFLKKLF